MASDRLVISRAPAKVRVLRQVASENRVGLAAGKCGLPSPRPRPPLRVARRAVARGRSPPSPVGLRRGSIHSLRERRLVGPAGLEPATRPL
jgi:hypothetical protein